MLVYGDRNSSCSKCVGKPLLPFTFQTENEKKCEIENEKKI